MYACPGDLIKQHRSCPTDLFRGTLIKERVYFCPTGTYNTLHSSIFSHSNHLWRPVESATTESQGILFCGSLSDVV